MRQVRIPISKCLNIELPLSIFYQSFCFHSHHRTTVILFINLVNLAMAKTDQDQIETVLFGMRLIPNLRWLSCSVFKQRKFSNWCLVVQKISLIIIGYDFEIKRSPTYALSKLLNSVDRLDCYPAAQLRCREVVR